MKNRAILLLSCPDQKGILASISNFIYKNNGNIITADQYTDFDSNMFFMRLEWDMEDFKYSKQELLQGKTEFEELVKKFNIKYQLFFSDDENNVAIFVTKQEHCLLELLWRFKQKELDGTVKCIISNHEVLKDIAESFDIPYYYFPITKENKLEVEEKEKEVLKKYNVNLIVLAKYMQVLSDDFVKEYEGKIINIHHSFLPAFEGARPYHRAYERGVKLIGATVHYVNNELDKGPIIDQKVVRVSHHDRVEDFIRKGKDIEKFLLVEGVRLHLDHKILIYNNKTILFT